MNPAVQPQSRARVRALHLTRLLALLSALSALSARAQELAPVSRPPPPPRVQIAILLDNSGSMQGLIQQARVQLWKIVNQFATAKQRGQRVRLELALYEYGERPRQLVPFTQDLDKVSETLFGLGIRGGEEHCGEVIQMATRQLEWSGNPDDLKLIYIAGNEPFTQGPVHHREAIAQAKERGITVNTIHCGGDEPSWREGALVAGGSFLTINHNAAVAEIATPHDAQLARLGAQLNQTYLGYGAMGTTGRARQEAQDKNAAAAAPSAAVSRSVAKSSQMYSNAEWDLVDGMKEGKVSVEKLKDDQLPGEMRNLSKDERAAFVARKAKDREELRKQIADLSAKREGYLAEERKKQAAPGAATLDTAVIESVRSAAADKAMSF